MTRNFPLFKKMVASQPHTITLEEIEILSFLRQNIIRKICEESARQGYVRNDPGSYELCVIISTWAPPPTGCSRQRSSGWLIPFQGEFHGSQLMSPHMNRSNFGLME